MVNLSWSMEFVSDGQQRLCLNITFDQQLLTPASN